MDEIELRNFEAVYDSKYNFDQYPDDDFEDDDEIDIPDDGD